jgi:thioredoxin-like negative regulator of GroEL
MPIKRFNTDQNPALVDRWQIKGTPTFVMLVDAKEVSRSIGALDVGQLRGWYKATQDWSRKLKGESP